MRPKPFADDDVLQAISVQIGQGKGVRLRKTDAVFCFLGARAHQGMFLKRNLPIFAHLLEPRETPAMRIKGDDDVVLSVTVDVVGEHLRAAFSAEAKAMFDPERT